jgi:uncharacterized protein (TIGR02186 family)
MRAPLLIAACALTLWAAAAAQEADREEIQADISTREVSIKSNFTGMEILIFGSVESTQVPLPEQGSYDVIIVVRGPSTPMIARRKERVMGVWVNGASKVYPTVPGFYAVLSSRPFRAIASDQTLKELGIGLSNVDLGRRTSGDPEEQTFRTALIRLKQNQSLFQEHDDGVSFIGRSLFRATVDLPVNVPIGRYFTNIYLFRDGGLIAKNESSLKVDKVGLERVIYSLAFKRPFLYGLLAVLIAVAAGLLGWAFFRRD